MAGFIKDDATPDAGGERGADDAAMAAIRLRSEMQTAVQTLRTRLPQAFPRWQQRRSDAARAADD